MLSNSNIYFRNDFNNNNFIMTTEDKLKQELEIHQMLLDNSEYSNKWLTWISIALSLTVIIMAS